VTQDDRIRVGRKLRLLRTVKDLDQIVLAKKAGVSVGTLQAIERALYPVKDRNIEKVARALGTSCAPVFLSSDDAAAAVTPDGDRNERPASPGLASGGAASAPAPAKYVVWNTHVPGTIALSMVRTPAPSPPARPAVASNRTAPIYLRK
jgi:transcriptional regulator with XRE-family HTH domain